MKERQIQIALAAMDLFLEYGYDEVTRADIMAHFGQVPSAMYRHFHSKQEIYQEGVALLSSRLADRLTGSLSFTNLPLPIVIPILPTLPQVYPYPIEDKTKGIHHDLLFRIAANMVPIWERRLKQAKEQREVEIDDVSLKARVCVYGQIGIFLDEGLSGPEKIDKTKEFLFHLLWMDKSH